MSRSTLQCARITARRIKKLSMSLLVGRHAKYFELCSHSLPLQAQSEDSNKLSIVYFVLHGLGLLGQLDRIGDPAPHIENIYDHLIPLRDESMQAFRPSNTFALDPAKNDYDLPNLSATFFALSILLVLGEDFSRTLDRHRIMKFVSQCQVKSGPNKGSFCPILGADGQPWGDTDVRICYMATLIRKLVGYDRLAPSDRKNDINLDDLTHFITSKVNYNGGLASHSHTESHAGLTFCGVAALKLIGFDFNQNQDWVELTKDWLVHRQVDYSDSLCFDDYEYYESEDVGGLNGRENKFADTCYAWWVIGLLKLIDSDGVLLVDAQKVVDYLLDRTQHKIMGGFGKSPGAFPDPFHSFLALASVSIIKHNSAVCGEGMQDLRGIDPELVITQESREFLDSMWT